MSLSVFNLLRNKLILIGPKDCPPKIYEEVAKKYPNGIAEKWFEADLADISKNEAELAFTAKKLPAKKVKVRPASDVQFMRVTRSSRAKFGLTVDDLDASGGAGPSNLDGTSDSLERPKDDAPAEGLGRPGSVSSPRSSPTGNPDPGPSISAENSELLCCKGYSPLLPAGISTGVTIRSNSSAEKSSNITLGEPAVPINQQPPKRRDSLSPKGHNQSGPKVRLKLSSSDESLRHSYNNNGKDDKTKTNKTNKRGSGTSPSEGSNDGLKKISFYSSSSESPELAAGDKHRNLTGTRRKRPVSLCSDGVNARGVKRVKFSDSSSSPEFDEDDEVTNSGAQATAMRMRPVRLSPNAQIVSHLSLRQKTKSPSVVVVEERKRTASPDLIDLTGSEDDVTPDQPTEATQDVQPKEEPEEHSGQPIKREREPVTPPDKAITEKEPKSDESTTSSTLTEIDDDEMARLEKSHAEYIQSTSTGSDPSPPSRHSAAATTTKTKTTDKSKSNKTNKTSKSPTAISTFPRFLVLDAKTWDITGYHTASRARARCQEHPIAVRVATGGNKHKKRTVMRARRNNQLAVGAPIDVGHGGMQLYVHDAAHNSVAAALMNAGVAAFARKWDRKLAREVVFGRERRWVGEWARERGLAAAAGDGCDGDGDGEEAKKGGGFVNSGPSPLWYQIKRKVEELRRIEGYAKKEEEKEEKGSEGGEMARAERASERASE
ncbi:uncharacterized protein IWZ02DRAFT_490891 [Phyllosticta citriasiana]